MLTDEPCAGAPPRRSRSSSASAARFANGREGGRVHLDRWLPFLVLHRSPRPPRQPRRGGRDQQPRPISSGRRTTMAALAALEAVRSRRNARSAGCASWSSTDRPWARRKELAGCTRSFRGRRGDKGTIGAARRARNGDRGHRDRPSPLQGRECRLRHLLRAVRSALDQSRRSSGCSLRVPQIHRRDDGGVYPRAAHDLAAASATPLLRRPAPSWTTARPRRRPLSRAWPKRLLAAAQGRPEARPGRAASTSCCRCRRSTPPRRWTASSPRARQAAALPLPAADRRSRRPPSASSTRSTSARSRTRCSSACSARSGRSSIQQLTMLATRNTPAFRRRRLLYGAVERGPARGRARDPRRRREGAPRDGGRRPGRSPRRRAALVEATGAPTGLRRRRRGARRRRRPDGFGRKLMIVGDSR